MNICIYVARAYWYTCIFVSMCISKIYFFISGIYKYFTETSKKFNVLLTRNRTILKFVCVSYSKLIQQKDQTSLKLDKKEIFYISYDRELKLYRLSQDKNSHNHIKQVLLKLQNAILDHYLRKKTSTNKTSPSIRIHKLENKSTRYRTNLFLFRPI